MLWNWVIHMTWWVRMLCVLPGQNFISSHFSFVFFFSKPALLVFLLAIRSSLHFIGHKMFPTDTHIFNFLLGFVICWANGLNPNWTDTFIWCKSWKLWRVCLLCTNHSPICFWNPSVLYVSNFITIQWMLLKLIVFYVLLAPSLAFRLLAFVWWFGQLWIDMTGAFCIPQLLCSIQYGK